AKEVSARRPEGISLAPELLVVEVQVYERVACEKGHYGSHSEERAEGHSHLPGLGAVPGEEDDGGDQGREDAHHERHWNRAAEHGAEKKGELHIPHSHPARIDQREDKHERECSCG